MKGQKKKHQQKSPYNEIKSETSSQDKNKIIASLGEQLMNKTNECDELCAELKENNKEIHHLRKNNGILKLREFSLLTDCSNYKNEIRLQKIELQKMIAAPRTHQTTSQTTQTETSTKMQCECIKNYPHQPVQIKDSQTQTTETEHVTTKCSQTQTIQPVQIQATQTQPLQTKSCESQTDVCQNVVSLGVQTELDQILPTPSIPEPKDVQTMSIQTDSTPIQNSTELLSPSIVLPAINTTAKSEQEGSLPYRPPHRRKQAQNYRSSTPLFDFRDDSSIKSINSSYTTQPTYLFGHHGQKFKYSEMKRTERRPPIANNSRFNQRKVNSSAEHLSRFQYQQVSQNINSYNYSDQRHKSMNAYSRSQNSRDNLSTPLHYVRNNFANIVSDAVSQVLKYAIPCY